MNKRNLALVMFMLIALLTLSAFGWAPSHFGSAAYYQSERADYSAFYMSGLVSQRSLDATAARYTAMAAFNNAGTSSIQSGLEADAARYTAMAAFDNAVTSSIQSGLEADAARYTAMAAFNNAGTNSIQSGMEADAARYTAMAMYHQSEWNSTAISFHYTYPGR